MSQPSRAAVQKVRHWSKPARPAVLAGSNVPCSRAIGSDCHRLVRRPSRRALRSSAASIQRAAPMKTTVMTTRIAASTAAGGVPPSPGASTKASWRMASRPTASGRIEMARLPTKPSRPTGKLSPDTK